MNEHNLSYQASTNNPNDIQHEPGIIHPDYAAFDITPAKAAELARLGISLPELEHSTSTPLSFHLKFIAFWFAVFVAFGLLVI